jgi:O-antigen/teichoic acid export membrane protein
LTLGQWFKHLSVYGVGFLVLNALSFFLLPIYTHRISPGEYGVLELLNRSRDVLLIVLTCGMGLATLTFYQLEGKDPNRQKKVFSTAIRGMFLAAGSIVLVLQFCARWLSTMLFHTPAYFWAVQIVLWVGLFELVFQIGLISMQARFKSLLYVILTIGRLVFGVAVNIVLVLWLRWGLKGILLATLIHTALFALVAAASVFWDAGLGFDWHLWREMLRFGLPFIPASLFLFVLNNGDRYFLQAYRGPTVLGIYALGYTLGQIAVLAVLSPFLKVWGPVMVAITGRPNGHEQVAKIATYLALVYVGVGLGLSLLGPFLVRLLTGPDYWSGFRVIPLIVLAYLFWSLSTVADTAFYVTKKTHFKPFIMGAAAAVCLLLYAVLIPRYGMMGAAVATLASFVFFAVLTWIIAYRYLPIRYEFGRLAKIVGAACFVYAVGHPVSTGGSWVGILASALLWLAFPGLLYLMRFPTVEERLRIHSLWNAALSRVSIFATG